MSAGRGIGAGGRACLALVYAYLYAPIVVLVVFSFNGSRRLAVWEGFSLDWYRRAWEDAAVVDAMRTSLLVALACTAIAVAIGTPAALALGRHRFRGRSLAAALVSLPVVVPEIVLGFASVAFFGLVGWKLGFASVLVAHVAFTISFVVFVVRARLSVLDPRFEEAAADLGATPLVTFRRVTLPLLAPGILAAALLVFTVSLDDYVVTSFVAGRGGTTLPLKIYSMVKTGVTPEINAISTILLGVTFVLVVIAQRLQSGRAGKGAVAVAAAAILAVTGFAVGGSQQRAERPQLTVYIWADYFSDEMEREFERRYDVDVVMEYFDSNEALLAKLQTGVSSYDVVVPSDYMVGILAREGLLEELDVRRLENFGNLMPRFVGLPFDPENRYSVPYCWGTSGIGYRRDDVGREIVSWHDLWDPKLAGRVGMLNDTRETFAAALKAMGLSLNATDPAEIEAAARMLVRQKSLVRTYDSDTFADSLLAGELWATQAYNGQVAKAAREDPSIGYAIPVEGCTLFVDNVCIPKGAANKDLAMLFIDFVLEGRVAASITEVTDYATANQAAAEFLPRELREDPIIFPPAELLDRCELIRDVGPVIELYDRLWTEIKS